MRADQNINVHADPFSEALDQLTAYGLVIESFEADGRLHRVQYEDDRRGSTAGWYVAHELVTQGGRRMVVGCFGWWKEQIIHSIKVSSGGMSDGDRQALAQQRRAIQKQIKQEREALAAEAAERAAKIWAGLPEIGGSPYLQRKQVGINGCRPGRDGTIVVPVRGIDGRLTGLQFIAADGVKRFLTGTAVKAAFHMIGKPAGDLPLLVAEGFATAAAVAQATGWPCAVAFNAGNLKPVAETLRRAYPQSRIIIAGDDDTATAGNPGRTKALAAAAAVDGSAVFPEFIGVERGTDWNDLWVAIGPAATRAQLLQATGKTESPPPPSVGGGVSFNFDLLTLLEEFALVYGTETVFDQRINRIITLSGLRAAAGRDLVKIWLEHPERRAVLPEGVVFEPGGAIAPEQVNLFCGWPIEPRAADITRLLEMLFYLCGESDNVFDWVLKWCAYPLQNPGAKMRSAIVMHGPEGTGKNLWWGAIRDIYGEYGSIITQTELESQFNAWASRKLFCIGNEVVSRQEMYHQKGRLKNMITEPEWLINEKMLPTRMEANHANFVFLSNVITPAAPDPDDRRYMVIWTPPKLGKDYYRGVVAEQRRTGPGALYHYLLNYELGDFDEHTVPMDTEAKRDLIMASLGGPELFWLEWSGGDLSAPFAPCTKNDLFVYYQKWSRDNGENWSVSKNKFSVILGKRMGSDNAWVSNGTSKRKARVWLPNDWRPDDDVPRQTAISKSVDNFVKLAGLEET